LGLYYMRARYYNPLTGRFVSVDSEAGEGQRRYEYAAADPVDDMDPSGNEAIVEFALLQFYPGRLPFNLGFRISWCGFAGSGYLLGCGSGASGSGSGGGGQGPGGPPPPPPPPCTSPNCKHLILFQGTPVIYGTNNGYINVLWTLKNTDGTLPGSPYYVTEQQSVKRLAKNRSGSGRTWDFPNKFDDEIGTPQIYDPVDSTQTFSISLSAPDKNGWSMGSMHVDVSIGGQHYCAVHLHLDASKGGPGTSETGYNPPGCIPQ